MTPDTFMMIEKSKAKGHENIGCGDIHRMIKNYDTKYWYDRFPYTFTL